MPAEDKLTHGQRIRLESFAQALNSQMAVRISTGSGTPPINVSSVAGRIGGEPPVTMADVFRRAEEIEAWLRKAPER